MRIGEAGMYFGMKKGEATRVQEVTTKQFVKLELAGVLIIPQKILHTVAGSDIREEHSSFLLKQVS